MNTFISLFNLPKKALIAQPELEEKINISALPFASQNTFHSSISSPLPPCPISVFLIKPVTKVFDLNICKRLLHYHIHKLFRQELHFYTTIFPNQQISGFTCEEENLPETATCSHCGLIKNSILKQLKHLCYLSFSLRSQLVPVLGA